MATALLTFIVWWLGACVGQLILLPFGGPDWSIVFGIALGATAHYVVEELLPKR
jgi:zinc transporter ZupT